MKVDKSIVKNDGIVMLLQTIMGRELFESGWAYNIFAGMFFDKSKSCISFLNYEWLWKDGVFIKKYVEYPSGGNLDDFYKYLDTILNDSYIIMHMENIEKNEKNSKLMLISKLDESKKKICIFDEKGLVFERKQDICEAINLCNKEGIGANYRFDILYSTTIGKRCFSKQRLIKDIDGKKLHLKDIIFLPKEQKRKSILAFKDWYYIYQRRIQFLEKNKNLRNELICVDEILTSNKSNFIKLLCLIKKYNRICNIIGSEQCERK